MNNRTKVANRLLRTMSAADYGLLASHLTEVELPKGQTLIEPFEPLRHSWFPLSGLASVVATTQSGSQAEVGVVGREGLVSTATIHGIDAIPLRCFMQLPGTGLRIKVEDLRRAIEQSRTLERLLLAYAECFALQIAGTSLAYATRTIEERLARWLLMCDDRADGGLVPLTHEQLSLMLGVRRAGVTVALQSLEGAQIVETKRGVIRILDRDGLLRLAGDAYGGPEADFERLIGSDPSSEPRVVEAGRSAFKAG